MVRVIARPVCVLVSFCSLFYCDGFFALAHARQVTDDVRADFDGTSYHFRHQSVAVALARFSGTASNGPIGAVFQSRLSLYWDFDGRMVAATTPTESLTFSYDVDGIRWRKTVGGVATHFVVDKNRDFAQVLEERDAAGAIDVLYVYGDDLISQERAATGLRFYHVDGQISTRQLTDSSANPTDSYTFDAFGVTLAQTGTTPNNFLYTGEQLDPNVGAFYLRARYLNQLAGRFMSPDSEQGARTDPRSLHKYLYAHGDPTNGRDPSGTRTSVETVVSTAFAIMLFALLAIGPVGALKSGPLQVRLAVNFLFLSGGEAQHRLMLQRATEIWAQAGILFAVTSTRRWSRAETEGVIGADLELFSSLGAGGGATAEEFDLTHGQSPDVVNVYYVRRIWTGTFGVAYTQPLYLAPPYPSVVVSGEADPTSSKLVVTLAHEIGHILLGAGHHENERNLMANADINTGEGILTAEQRAQARRHPLANK